jgi:hypothetical protein
VADLRAELLAMAQADLNLREELVRDGTLFDGYNKRMAALHRQHNLRLQEILDQHGWPTRREVGDDGANAAWLILQHAVLAPDLMRAALVLMQQSVSDGDCEPKHLAYLTDRVRTLEGRSQLFGTQHDWDPDGQISPLAIEAPEDVDERRRRVGLEPLMEATHRLRQQAAAEGEQPPVSYQARQDEKERWARSSGWRS